MDLLCLVQIVPLPGRQTRGSLDTHAQACHFEWRNSFTFGIVFVMPSESRVFFMLIYLYFGYEYGDTRNFNDSCLKYRIIEIRVISIGELFLLDLVKRFHGM